MAKRLLNFFGKRWINAILSAVNTSITLLHGYKLATVLALRVCVGEHLFSVHFYSNIFLKKRAWKATKNIQNKQ